MTKTLLIANPIGFCGGVRRAVEMFDTLAAQHQGETIYVLHELVHNRIVTESMRQRGAVFVDDLSQVPDGAVLLLGAHGCGPSTLDLCHTHHLDTHDAVCPLVVKLQNLAVSCDHAMPVILLGDGNHPEVRGILERLTEHTVHLIRNDDDARALPRLEKAVFLSQTTRSFTEIDRIRDILLTRVEHLDDQAHACDAVFLRQKAIETLAKQCEQIYIIGSKNSSNARRLVEIAQEAGVPSVNLIDGIEDIPLNQLESLSTIGLGAATSTPDSAINDVIHFLETQGFDHK